MFSNLVVHLGYASFEVVYGDNRPFNRNRHWRKQSEKSMSRHTMKTRIETALNSAIDQLLTADHDVIENNVNERTISHRLAIYLESHFPEWDIDCEYNRDHDDSKKINITRRNTSSDDTHATTVFPDIIIHKRGTRRNLLVIEIKKTTSSEPDAYDLGKLKAFKQQLGYKFAVFLKLKTGSNPGVECLNWQ